MKQGRESTPSKKSSQEELVSTNSLFLRQLGKENSNISTIQANFSQTTDQFGKVVDMLPYFVKNDKPLFIGFAVFRTKIPNQALQKEFSRKMNSEMNLQECSQNVIWTPKPTKTFCHICKINFDDYMAHVDMESHIKKAKYESEQIKQIRNIIKLYSSEIAPSRRRRTSNLRQQQIESGNYPKKRRAIQEIPNTFQKKFQEK